jgi:hypothetical protein
MALFEMDTLDVGRKPPKGFRRKLSEKLVLPDT